MKYNISLCCIIKNESYLEEFMTYYILLGVEHFYIYDNDSDIEIITSLKNKCTIIPYPGELKQMEAYHNCLNICKTETEWLLIIDVNEYVVPNKHVSLTSFLSDYDDYNAIGINCVMFNSNYQGRIQSEFIIQNEHIKTVCRPGTVIKMNEPHSVVLSEPSKFIDPHKRIISGPFNSKRTIDIIQINHYSQDISL